jgi:hypothetical protein
MWAGILSFTFQYLSTELQIEIFERAFSDRLSYMFELVEDEDLREKWIEKKWTSHKVRPTLIYTVPVTNDWIHCNSI